MNSGKKKNHVQLLDKDIWTLHLFCVDFYNWQNIFGWPVWQKLTELLWFCVLLELTYWWQQSPCIIICVGISLISIGDVFAVSFLVVLICKRNWPFVLMLKVRKVCGKTIWEKTKWKYFWYDHLSDFIFLFQARQKCQQAEFWVWTQLHMSYVLQSSLCPSILLDIKTISAT